MSSADDARAHDDLRSATMRLVETLDRTEVKVLACLVEGMSRRDIASCFGLSLDEVEQAVLSTMKKLNASGMAAAVGIGITAGVKRTD